MWRLFKGCGIGYPGLTTVSGCGLETSEVADLWTEPLDPVDPELAGGANIKKLKNSLKKWPFAILGLLLISDLTTFIREVEPPESWATTRRATDVRWAEHFATLELFGLLRKTSRARQVSGYFAIKKSSGGCKSIFNGKHFSNQCKTPLPTNLPDITRVLKGLSRFFVGCRRPIISIA